MELKKRKIPLGKACRKAGVGIKSAPSTLEERISALEAMVETVLETVRDIRAGQENEKKTPEQNVYKEKTSSNKDGIPYGTVFVAVTFGWPVLMKTKRQGYEFKRQFYDSLSAAAEAASGCRRSGWTFWHLPDGRSAKEAFRYGKQEK